MSKTKVKILHIFGGMNRGGAEMRTLDILRNIDRDKYQMDFCTLSGKPGDLDSVVYELGSVIHSLDYKKIDFGKNFKNVLRNHSYDVVHSHVHTFSGYVLYLAEKENVRTRIAHFRNTTDGQGATFRRKLQKKIMSHLIDKHATHILAVSEGSMAATWGEEWKQDPRCKVIYNGIDDSVFKAKTDFKGIRKELNISAAMPLFVHVGRMVKQKNHLRLLSIFKEIMLKDPSSQLLIVGKGESAEEEAIREKIEDYNLKSNVHILGPRNDVPKILKEANLLILPSLWEGLPGVVLEACAAGLPVLGSDLTGVREISAHFKHVKYLSLTEEDETWAELALQLTNLGENSFERSSYAETFNKSIFTIQNCVEMNSKIWEGVDKTG
ncbi:glycosyltransferase [Paenibacillus chitinolyticus]|uniref:glycosyltransferase n=1 Tax=Paenibacillus chitinolyticus TaxID=79263 RepID=UPI003D000509